MTAPAQKKIIVIEGPSGAGKDTVINELIRRAPHLEYVTSYITRAPREKEIPGYSYFFTDEKTFLEKVKLGDIFEHTTRHGTYRGMSKTVIDNILANGKTPVKDSDIHGVRALRKTYPDGVLAIFLNADKEIVRERLKRRGDRDIEIRIADYDDIQKTKAEYDRVVTNNGTLDAVVRKILDILGEQNGRKTKPNHR